MYLTQSTSSPLNTYIIGHYNTSVRIMDLVSNTTYIVCVNFIYNGRDLQFKVKSELQIFWETFHSNLFTFRIFARNLLRGNRRRNIFCILFWCLGLNPGFEQPYYYLIFFFFFGPDYLAHWKKWQCNVTHISYYIARPLRSLLTK